MYLNSLPMFEMLTGMHAHKTTVSAPHDLMNKVQSKNPPAR